MNHKHHIVPRHAGGTDDPDNLIELCPEDHAWAHVLLYFAHGRWQDKLASKMLFGHVGKEEALQEIRRQNGLSRKGSANGMYGVRRFGSDNPNFGKKHPGMGSGEANSMFGNGHRVAGERNGMFGKEPWNKGEDPKRLDCPHCGKSTDYRNASRWHFDNCKEA